VSPFYFAGISREWASDRWTKKAPNIGKQLLFSFLTTEPNGVVEPPHNKAMPVLIRAKDEAEQWLEAPPRGPCSCRGRRPTMSSSCCRREKGDLKPGAAMNGRVLDRCSTEGCDPDPGLPCAGVRGGQLPDCQTVPQDPRTARARIPSGQIRFLP